MGIATALSKNITFWHWYPHLLAEGLTPEQLRWQPDGHDTSIAFAIWHSYRACDELVSGMVMARPSVFASQGWAERLHADQMGFTPFGNGASREQIGALRFETEHLLAYPVAVGAAINDYLATLSDDDASADVSLPFFKDVYPGVDVMTRLETIAFFAIGHTSEHLGEVQLIKGLLGMKGAPL